MLRIRPLLRQTTLFRHMSTSKTPITDAIESRVEQEFTPSHFKVFNDSHKHAHHAAMRGSDNTIESHFRLVIVSDKFQGKSAPIRHRMVYKLFEEEMAQPNGLHALSLTTKTPEEWKALEEKST
ncbi:putative bolA-like protein [Yarrowia sp. C11]|nr:putative bolA-like protein [Yarrowia sp. E02]KAG5372337.1 putative bolA-like protein [Yarrowia sp. C11]